MEIYSADTQLLFKTEAGVQLFTAVFVQKLLSIDNEMLVWFPENTSGENLRINTVCEFQSDSAWAPGSRLLWKELEEQASRLLLSAL